jgi:hypothetical protein
MSEKVKLKIDVAIICQEISKIETMCDKYNIVELDNILITKDKFRQLFFHYGENFGLEKKTAINQENIHYISFSQEYRTINKNKFYLLDKILQNLEVDLNVSRDCFTVETRVALAKELTNIKSLCDIDCCSVISSLTWQNIEDIIRDHSKLNDNKKIQAYLCVSIIFRTPTEGARDTLIKFTYKIVN